MKILNFLRSLLPVGLVASSLLTSPVRAGEMAASTPLANSKPGKTQQLTSPDQVPEGLQKSDWANIRAAHTAWEHGFMPIEGQPGMWQARNPGQQWTTKFDAGGFLTTPKDGGWTWGLELQSYGVGEQQTPVSGKPAMKSEGQRLTYQWDATIQEWWVNDQRGLEHGYTLTRRPAPASDARLNLTLTTRGNLQPKISDNALGVTFRDASGAAVLNYTGLKVTDADGRMLASRFEPAGERSMRLVVDDRTARYPVTIDPIAQQAYLKASNTGAGDYFGLFVAISGDTVVVGAPYEDSSTTGVNSTPNEAAANSGAAYVFVRNGAVWTQQAYLKASNTGANDEFGRSVAVSSDTVVVGAREEDSAATGVNSVPNEAATDSGAAYVFVRNGAVWTQQAYLKASNTGASDYFGESVSVSGDTVVVGAAWEDSSTTGINSTPDEGALDAGAAYVFVRSGTTWSQQAYLKPVAVGTTQVGDNFGDSVAVSGDTVVVGAPTEDSSTTGINSTRNESASAAGAAYVFVRSGTTWSQQAYLKPAVVGSAQAGDQFGYSVAVSGDTVVVGAHLEDSSTTGINSTPNEATADSGAAYVFTRSGAEWTQQAYLKASNTEGTDYFGRSVAVSGDMVVVGAYGESGGATGVNGNQADNSVTDSGAAYVFERSGSTWSQRAYLKAFNTGANDLFGVSVAVSGDTVVVGSHYEDSSITGINSTPNEAAANSGAAYIFTGFGPAPDIAVTQNAPVADGGSVDFGNVMIGSSGMPKTFTITNPGTAALTLGAITKDGTNPSDFTVNTTGMLTTVPLGGSTTFSVTFSPTAAGLLSAAIHIPSNVSGAANPFDINLTGTGLTEQESWRLLYFGTTADAGIAADTADPDGDGHNNLFEFVAGLVPNDAGSRFQVRIESVTGQPAQRAIIFSPLFAGRTYVVKSKAVLTDATWTPLGSFTTTDNGDERTVTDLNAGTGPKFYVIEITKP